MARPLIIIAVLALAAAEARPGCSEKDEAAMAESYQKCLTDVNERSHKEMAKIKSNSDYQVGKVQYWKNAFSQPLRCNFDGHCRIVFALHFPPSRAVIHYFAQVFIRSQVVAERALHSGERLREKAAVFVARNCPPPRVKVNRIFRRRGE